LAYAKAYLTQPTPTFASNYDIRPAAEADVRWIAPRLALGSLNELDAITTFQPISVLFKDMGRKAVIVDKAKPTSPLMIFDVAPVVEKPMAIFWSALIDGLIGEGASAYANGFLDHVNKSYPTILTHVDARNIRHIAFLEHVGFSRTEEIPHYGRKELKFYMYTRTGSQQDNV
jgi:hypothetical protein